MAKRARQAKAKTSPRSSKIRTRARILEVGILSPGEEGTVHIPRPTELLAGFAIVRLSEEDTPPVVTEIDPA